MSTNIFRRKKRRKKAKEKKGRRKRRTSSCGCLLSALLLLIPLLILLLPVYNSCSPTTSTQTPHISQDIIPHLLVFLLLRESRRFRLNRETPIIRRCAMLPPHEFKSRLEGTISPQKNPRYSPRAQTDVSNPLLIPDG